MCTSIKLSLCIGALLCASVFPSAARADITGDTLFLSYVIGPVGINDDYIRYDLPNFTANGVGHDFMGYLSFAADGSHLYFYVDSGHAGQRLTGSNQNISFDGPTITDITNSLAGYSVSLDPSSTGTGLDNPLFVGISYGVFEADFGGLNLTPGASLIYDLTLIPPTTPTPPTDPNLPTPPTDPTPPTNPAPPTTPIAATPEPSSLALLGTGLFGVVGMVRRRVKA